MKPTAMQIIHGAQLIAQADMDAVGRTIAAEQAKLEALATSNDPPRQLSNEPTDPFFRPDYMRVGVKIDGVERKDVAWYNADHLVYKTVGGGSYGADSIEPFWRYPSTRQERRLVERYMKKRNRK